MDSFNQHENLIKIDLKSTAKVNTKFITYFDNNFDCLILKIELLNSLCSRFFILIFKIFFE